MLRPYPYVALQHTLTGTYLPQSTLYRLLAKVGVANAVVPEYVPSFNDAAEPRYLLSARPAWAPAVVHHAVTDHKERAADLVLLQNGQKFWGRRHRMVVKGPADLMSSTENFILLARDTKGGAGFCIEGGTKNGC